MFKRIVFHTCLFILCLSFILQPVESFAADEKVNVSLPNFTITLNGNVVENQYRQYPFLVYKDITYFPMTWYDSRLLGLETKWSEDKGLEISQGKLTSSYADYKTNKKNSKNLIATIPAFDIRVNGKYIDNLKEEYPLLIYNNVTYFPLTWRFAHDEFGWEYNWDDNKGLSINSINPQVKKVNLPKYAGENDVAYYNGYYYYVETVGTINNVYRTPEKDTSIKKLVYSYEVSTLYGINNRLNFEIRDGELWFTYHYGGAVMGSDLYCKVNEDGKATLEQRGYLDFVNLQDYTLIITQFPAPDGNNLILTPKGKGWDEGRRVGDPNLIYGWVINPRPDGGASYITNNSTTVIGDDIYVIGSSFPVWERDKHNRLYKINMNTDETVKVLDFEIKDFKITVDKIYYIKNEDGFLYSSNLDGTGEIKLSNNKLHDYYRWFDVVDGKVYYTLRTEDESVEEYYLYKAEGGEDKKVLEEALQKVQLMEDKIVCLLGAGEDYGVKVLDSDGNLLLAITDKANDVFPYKGRLLITGNNKEIKTVKLY